MEKSNIATLKFANEPKPLEDRRFETDMNAAIVGKAIIEKEGSEKRHSQKQAKAKMVEKSGLQSKSTVK